MKKDLTLAWLVTRRELRDQLRDWRILFPMFILTVFFPFLMIYTAGRAIGYVEKFGASLIADRMVPFLLLVVGFFPVTSSLIVALESFVGEKERGTIEPLLSSPLTDWHLYVGKLMAGTIVPLVASYIGITIYILGILAQGLVFPDLNLFVQTLALTAVQTVLMVSAAMVISAQSTSVRAANLLASFIIIPVTFLIQGESTLMFWGSNQVLWLAVLGVLIVSVLLIRLGLVHFQRENLLGRDIDMLNLRWVWMVFWRAFSGSDESPQWTRWLASAWRRLRHKSPAGGESIHLPHAVVKDFRGLFAWYGREIPRVLRKIRTALIATAMLGLIAVLFGYIYAETQIVPLAQNHINGKSFEEMSQEITKALNLNADAITAPYLFSHNLNAELGILFFGVFSFGVLGALIYGANLGLIGGLLALVKMAGYSPWAVFAAGILPHGIFEIPSLMLTSAVVLHLGVRMVTPDPGRSLGEVLIESLADWAKIALGLAIPLLIIAALIEAYVTPLILRLVFGGQI
jgi:uncharacterized membrane protein SpoIIM required for sporulation/ABC-type transport system involved in multi-copper enzyme maturation permease subunit